jgi:hypothetical protein
MVAQQVLVLFVEVRILVVQQILNNMTGYKAMIRDRMPLMLDLALKWCKAKERWINYVYDNIVRKYPENKRSIVVKQILGIKQRWKRQEIYDTFRYVEFKPVTKTQVDNIPKSELYMKFSDTIDWAVLSKEDPNMYEYWQAVASWVDWFSMNHLSAERTYKLSEQWAMSTDDVKPILMSKYGIDSKFADYLIKSFK